MLAAIDPVVTHDRLWTDLTPILRRICEQLGVAYAANRVARSLADIHEDSNFAANSDKLNLIGRSLGVRFRRFTGGFDDVANTVKNAGPVLLRRADSRYSCSWILILEQPGRNQTKVFIDGLEENYTNRELRELLGESGSLEHEWYLVQPMLLAEHASRFHYASGNSGDPIKPFARFVALLKPEAKDIRAILIFSVVVGLLSLTTPLAVEALVNTIAFGQYLQPLIVLSLMVLVFLGFLAGLNVLMTIMTEVIQRKLFVRTVEDLSYRLTRVPLSTWKQYHGPELVNRFFDVVNIQKITSKLLLETLMLGLQTVIGLTVLAFYHPFLLGYDIGLLALMTIVLWFMGRGAVKTAMKESHLKYETAAWLQEIVRHPSTFKFNGGLGYAINRADSLTSEYIQQRQDHFRILIRQISFSMTMQVFAATTLLALGGYLVIDGQMTLGQLVAAELIVTVILGSFAKLGKDLESFYDLMASVDKLGKLFDLPIENSDKLQLARRKGAYSLSMVNVKWDDFDLKNCSLELEANNTYAIYGSDELRRKRIIEGFIGQAKPDEGHFLLDDFRVDALGAESLQTKISVLQEIEIFDGTVDENVRMGRENIGSREMNSTIHQLGLRKTISNLRDGFATKLAISGFPLSAGDAVRLTLARSLIAKPAVLLVNGLLDRLSDDDTDDLLSRLGEFKQDTTIVIATGRRTIARWAEECLCSDDSVWQLGRYSG